MSDPPESGTRFIEDDWPDWCTEDLTVEEAGRLFYQQDPETAKRVALRVFLWWQQHVRSGRTLGDLFPPPVRDPSPSPTLDPPSIDG